MQVRQNVKGERVKLLNTTSAFSFRQYLSKNKADPFPDINLHIYIPDYKADEFATIRFWSAYKIRSRFNTSLECDINNSGFSRMSYN